MVRVHPKFVTGEFRLSINVLFVFSDVNTAYVPEETWAAPSVPLTNGFRYSMPEPVNVANQNSSPFTGYETPGFT